jgi:hypothetical protein
MKSMSEFEFDGLPVPRYDGRHDQEAIGSAPEDKRRLPPESVRRELARQVFFPSQQGLMLACEAFGADSRLYSEVYDLYDMSTRAPTAEMFRLQVLIHWGNQHLFRDLKTLGNFKRS